MRSKNQIPNEVRKSLQDFAIAYFFVFRVQLENAELIEKSLRGDIPKNSILLELGHGYINGAVREFVLLLYDTVELLKKNTGTYKYKTGGAIDQIFKFRRNILAHRGCNWGSDESKEIIQFLAQESIY